MEEKCSTVLYKRPNAVTEYIATIFLNFDFKDFSFLLFMAVNTELGKERHSH